MNSRRQVARIAGYGLSAVCIAGLAAGVDWSRFLANFRNASQLPLVAAVPLVALTYLLFALRWRLLLAFDPKPPVLRVFGYLMLGYLANVFFPLRAGDALRVVLLRKAYGYGTTRVVGSIALERVLDVLTLLAIGVAVAVAFDTTLPETIVIVLRTAGFLAAAALATIIAMALRPRVFARVVSGIARRLEARLGAALIAQSEQFVEAIGILLPRDRDSTIRAARVIALTVAGWAAYALAMTACSAAFGVEPAAAPALLLVVATNLGAAIPSSPASLGIYHALGVIALSPWGIGFDVALSVATATHAITVGVQIALGLLAMHFLRIAHPLASVSTLSDRGD